MRFGLVDILNRKISGQSAVEYLMTYGWMLLVVAIVGGSVFSVVQEGSIESRSGFQGDNIQASEFGMTSTGLGFVLENRAYEEAIINQINVSQQGSGAVIPFEKELDVSSVAGLKLPHVRQSSSTNTVNVELKYDYGELQNVTLEGNLKGGFEFDDSIVGYWTLRLGQAVGDKMFDISQNSAHGDLINVSFVRDDKFGEVMHFNGSTKIPLTGERGSVHTDDLTVMIWAQTNESNWILGEGALFRMHAEAGEDAGFWIRQEDFGESNMIHGGEVRENEWHHYAGVYNSKTGKQKLYLDGELVATGEPDFQAVGDYHKNLCVGESWCGSDSYFTGNATELMIFNRALGKDKIKEFAENPGFEIE